MYFGPNFDIGEITYEVFSTYLLTLGHSINHNHKPFFVKSKLSSILFLYIRTDYFVLLDIPSHFGCKVMVGQDLGIGYYYCSIYVPIPNSTELRIHILNIAAVMVYLILDAALGLLYLPTYSTLLPCVGILLRTCPSMH